MTNVRRIYVEKRKEYATEAHEIQTNLVEQLGLIDSFTSYCSSL